jgi:hypothetical protein
MKRRFLAIILLLGVLCLAVAPSIVYAQDYSFSVPQAQVNFFINKDGTASIEYFYDFTNLPGAHVIDYVDIGMPSNNYDLSSVVADVNGTPITDIEKSTVVDPGITLGLGSHAIPAGGSGRVHAKINVVRKIVYNSDLTNEKEAYASINFSPNWFDGAYAKGTTDYTVNILFPAALQENEPRYHIPQKWPGSSAPNTGVDQSTDLKFYQWHAANANIHTQYIFGASFPSRLVPAASIQTKPFITLPPIEDLICWGFAIFFVAVFGFAIYGSVVGARKRKMQYLPPKVAIEGNGIKRGLTAVEAAVLMEQPMDKILTMILFASVKKGAATVVTKEPLKLTVVDPLPDALQGYEKEFLYAFNESSLVERRKLLQTMMINLVKTITEKMKGFSRKETIAYYESIVNQAWQQVETAATPEVKSQAFDDNLDWTLLDRRFNDRTRDVFRTGPVYVPMWWGRYDPVFSQSSSGGGSPINLGGGQPIQIGRPNVPGADFAQSVVNSIQSVAAGAVGDLTAFTGGVTNKTNPIPVSNYSSSGRSGGGGGHCACACACAGCACACAGGGR